MNQRALQILAGAALLGLGVLLFFALFEKRTEEVDAPRDPLVARNPYRAAEILLRRMGLEVESLESPRDLDLDLTGGTVLLPTTRQTLSLRRSQELVDWVERGGNLIVVTWTIWDDPDRRPDPILDPLGLQQVYDEDVATETWPENAAPAEPGAEADADTDTEAQPEPEAEGQPEAEPETAQGEDPAEAQPDADADEEDGENAEPPPLFGDRAAKRRARAKAPPIATVDIPGRSEPLRAQFDPRFSWTDSQQRARFAISDAAGTHLVQVSLGEGTITALTDSGMLSNEGLWDEAEIFHYGGIANFDHAELLYRLATTGGRHGPVYVVWKEDWPGLGALLLEHAWQTVLSGGLLLVGWVWLRSRRLGPLLADQPADRRQLMEHVDAVGRFDWRNHAGRSLLASVRQALLDRVKVRYPNWAALGRIELARRLAEVAGLPVEQVEHALGPELPLSRGARDRESFVRNIATLEAVRKAL